MAALLPSTPERGNTTAFSIIQPPPELLDLRSECWQSWDRVGSGAVLWVVCKLWVYRMVVLGYNWQLNTRAQLGTLRNWGPPISGIILKMHFIHNDWENVWAGLIFQHRYIRVMIKSEKLAYTCPQILDIALFWEPWKTLLFHLFWCIQ